MSGKCDADVHRTEPFLMAMTKIYDQSYRRKMYDLNTILHVANIIVLIANIYYYFCNEQYNPYVDATTIAWSAILAMQVFIILYVEKQKRNPLLLLLALNTIVSYLVRILTLQAIPMSAFRVMSRVKMLDVQAINGAFPYIFCGIWVICVGLLFPVLRTRKSEATDMQRGDVCQQKNIGHMIKPRVVIALFVSSILLSSYVSFGADLKEIASLGDRLLSYANMLLTPDVVVLVVLSYMLTQKGRISKGEQGVLNALFVVYLVLRVLQGSRSGMLTILMSILLVVLSTYGFVRIRKKHLMIAVFVVLPVAVGLFAVGTSIRQVTYGVKVVGGNSEKDIERLYEEAIQSQYLSSESDKLLSTVYERTGFLADAADLIANHKRYSELINITYVFESLVDALTPGFDVFHVGKMSNKIQNIVNNVDLSYEFPATEYNSEIMTVYGEYYNLFHGYAGLIAMAFVSYLFMIFYMNLRYGKGRDEFRAVYYAALSLVVFQSWIDSFGTDWVIVEVVRKILSSIIILYVLGMISRKSISFGWAPMKRIPDPKEMLKLSCEREEN